MHHATNTSPSPQRIAVASLAAALLTACGTGGDDATTDATPAAGHVSAADSIDAGDWRDAYDAFIAEAGVESIDELRPDSLPDEENAAVIWRQAIDVIDGLSEAEHNQLSAAQFAGDVPDLLERLAPAIELAERAADLDRAHWRFDRHVAHGEDTYDVMLETFSSARRLSNALVLEAQRRLSERDDARVADAFRTTLRLGHHIRQEPGAIAALIGAGIEGRVIMELPERGTRINADQLARIIDELSESDLDASFRRVIISKTFEAMAHFDDPQTLAGIEEHLDFADDITPRQRDADRALLLELMRDELRAAGTPFHERASAIEAADLPAFAVVTRFTTEPLERLTHSWAGHRTRYRLAAAAVDVRRAFERDGRYPASYDMPVDPLDGRPMRYRRTADGAVLRSNGTNRGPAIEWRWER